MPTFKTKFVDHLNKEESWNNLRKKLAHHQLVLYVNVMKTDGNSLTMTIISAPLLLSAWLIKFF